MAEAVDWGADGTPRSPQFDDVYRPADTGLAQACHVFLGGCNLPRAWAGAAHWRILETGFGLGQNFLATWHAWQQDEARPRLLHYVSLEAWPVAASDLLRAASVDPQLVPLAQALARQWEGLTPGLHRLVFEGGRVALTLGIGDARDLLRGLDFRADSVFLDGFDPARNPELWSLPVLKAVARLCRRGTHVATWTAAGQVRRDLATCGFVVERQPGLPPKRHRTAGRFDPSWPRPDVDEPPAPTPGMAVVVGAGLAGSAVAASLARRGWQVQVFDAADAPSSGASALPAGLMAPYQSPDDNPLSRIARAGIRLTWLEAQRLLRPGEDWGPDGALECRLEDARPPPALGEGLLPWTRVATPAQLAAAGLASTDHAWWHERAAWVKPSALVRAWLAAPGVSVRCGVRVSHIEPVPTGWQLLGETGDTLATAAVVVVCAAHGTAALTGDAIRTHPVRGQVSWGMHADGASPGNWPATPVHGHGHMLPDVPVAGGRAWMVGATYSRDDADATPREADQTANQARLAVLSPALAQALAPAFASGAAQAWTGIRCVTRDRRPLAGWLAPGLGVSTALGSRGLTFAVLAAELLAARLHAEPLPVETPLADALDPGRLTSR